MSKITTYSAAGRVCTGFSKPYVADYAAEQGQVSISNPMVLARGVEVNIEPDTADDNNFYADNQLAESAAGMFTGGTLTLTVDGLNPAAESYIMGLPERGSDGWLNVGDDQAIPYVATGYIARYMCGGVTMYRPEIILKTKYNQLGIDAKTQEDQIDWQTRELSAVVMRADDSNHNWKLLGNDWSTEAEAETELVARLGGPATTHSITQNLTHATTSLYGNTIVDGENLVAFYTAEATYTISAVEVKVGGVDVTADTYLADQNAVVINGVSGDVVITVTATQ